jgi:bifunctional aspartokinase / homoserine dehydrogenase 1
MTRVEHKIDKSQVSMKMPLRVMKFGGTSVGDASCIARVAEIVRIASRESGVVVVVSAMSGVTNRLIEAANEADTGEASAIFAQLVKQHDDVVHALIRSAAGRRSLQNRLHALLAEGEGLCQGAIFGRKLTPRTLDAISGLGERLCAPLVAAALSEAGVASEAIDATRLVVTDSYHGGAEPRIAATRARCQALIAPLLLKGAVPVVTGFIGANEEGVRTTLGRGGSDYSATILGASLDASEVVIWSDVTGLLTADPKLVAEACTISEISYQEAAELAYFGAKVLHPKTLRPVMQSGIPVWIKNTFAPDKPGTKITAAGSSDVAGVTALAAVRDATLIGVRLGTAGPGNQSRKQDAADPLARVVATAAAVRADVLLISESAERNEICLAVASPAARLTVEALRHEFSPELQNEEQENSVFSSEVSVITVVSQNMPIVSEAVVLACAALGEENINILVTSNATSACNMSLAVPRQQMEMALAALHQELELGGGEANCHPGNSVAGTTLSNPEAMLKCQPQSVSAD